MTAASVPPRLRHLPRTGDYRWVSLWGVPLRAMHWISALCIVTLVVTGLYIGKPFFITSGETSSHYLMGWVRFIHFTAAAFLVMTAIVRVYWLLAGNRYERWTALVPVSGKDWKNLVRQAWSYIMIRPEEAPPYLGHNPLQQLSYTGLYAVAIVMVTTGFAMYGQSNPGGFFFRVFGWIGPLLGGMPNVRFLHHALTWVFAIYVPVHIYLSARADILEHNSTVSSIISGGRIVPVNQQFEDD